MAKKPELLINAGNLDEVIRYIQAGANAVNVGEQRFGMRLPGDMDLTEINKAVAEAHKLKANIIVSVDNIMDNRILDALPGYLRALQEVNVDAIVFGDPAVWRAAKAHAPRLRLHWSAEMTSTNYATANFWAAKGVARAVLARELNMEQVLEFKRRANLEVQVQVHGMTNIYHSKRELITHFMRHAHKDTGAETYDKARGMYLVESERPNQTFPIFEDVNGTHIMSSDDICMIENLPELLDGGIDSIKIEALLKPADYNETVLRAYRQAIDAYVANPATYEFNEDWLKAIKRKQDPKRELSYGFFYKEQVY
ncbi:MAG TPA: peptidase U32 family protein [Bacilli bacterium]